MLTGAVPHRSKYLKGGMQAVLSAIHHGMACDMQRQVLLTAGFNAIRPCIMKLEVLGFITLYMMLTLTGLFLKSGDART